MKKILIPILGLVLCILFCCTPKPKKTSIQFLSTPAGFQYYMHKNVDGPTPETGDIVRYHVHHRKGSTVTFSSRKLSKDAYSMELPDFANGANRPTPVSDVVRLMSAGDSATVRMDLRDLPGKPQGYENEDYINYDVYVTAVEKNVAPIDYEIEKLENQLGADLTPVSMDPQGNVNTKPKLTDAQKEDMWNYHMQKQLKAVMDIMVKEYKKGTLTQNKKYLTTESGLKVMPVKGGTGQKVKDDSYVAIKYMAASVESGEVFDQVWTKDRFMRFKMGKGEVTPGLEEAVKSMDLGSNYVFFVPPKLAYGEKGRVGVPPNSEVCYVITLNEIN